MLVRVCRALPNPEQLHRAQLQYDRNTQFRGNKMAMTQVLI